MRVSASTRKRRFWTISPRRLGALAVGPADPFVAIDELHGRRSPDQERRPTPPVMHHLEQRPPDFPAGSQVVLVLEQLPRPWLFCGLKCPHFQLFERHRCGLRATQ